MSDPVKNHELEDVLSSIRRLVSEDGYGGSTPEKTDDIPTEVAEVAIGRKRPEAPISDKLVLTEAFLVSESETAKEDEIAETTVETLVLGQAHSVEATPEPEEQDDVLVLNSVFDDLASEQSAQASEAVEYRDDVSLELEQVLEESPEAVFAHVETADDNDTGVEAAHHEAHEPEATQAVEDTAETAEDDNDDEHLQEVEHAADQDEPIEDTEIDHDDGQADAVHEMTEDHDPVHDEPEVEPVEDVVSDVFQINPADQIDDIEDAETIEEDQVEGTQNDFPEPSGLAHTVAELEAVISAQNDDWEPDGSEEEGSSPDIEPLEWRSETTRGAKVFEMPRAETPPSMPGFQGETELDDDVDFGLEDFADDDAPLLDEAALRAMVSDIVRQELQGPLGERITRNVRKLVRREIHRILASEDFD